MSDGPSRAEYTAFVERVYHTIERGFEQINERLDTLNGRTLKGEVADAALTVRIQNLEKEVFRERRTGSDRRGSDGEIAPAPVSRREGAVALAALAACVTALKVLELLLGKVWALLPGLK